MRLVISSSSESTWISKDQEAGAGVLVEGAEAAAVFWDFPFDKAVAIENGRLTLFRLAGSGRVPLVIFDLRANGLQMDLSD